jgi:hypothetical protein
MLGEQNIRLVDLIEAFLKTPKLDSFLFYTCRSYSLAAKVAVGISTVGPRKTVLHK